VEQQLQATEQQLQATEQQMEKVCRRCRQARQSQAVEACLQHRRVPSPAALIEIAAKLVIAADGVEVAVLVGTVETVEIAVTTAAAAAAVLFVEPAAHTDAAGVVVRV
jgi:hypothetical protein